MRGCPRNGRRKSRPIALIQTDPLLLTKMDPPDKPKRYRTRSNFVYAHKHPVVGIKTPSFLDNPLLCSGFHIPVLTKMEPKRSQSEAMMGYSEGETAFRWVAPFK